MKHQPIARENNAHAISYCPLEALNNASYFAVNSILPLDQERLNSHVLFHFNEHILIYFWSFLFNFLSTDIMLLIMELIPLSYDKFIYL